MSGDLFISLLAATILAGTPLLYATLGEMLTERSGVLNLGVEGMMLLGAFFAFFVEMKTGNHWLAVLAAGLGTGCIGLLHGVACLVFQGNQTVSGLALTIFGVGLSDYLGAVILHSEIDDVDVDFDLTQGYLENRDYVQFRVYQKSMVQKVLHLKDMEKISVVNIF